MFNILNIDFLKKVATKLDIYFSYIYSKIDNSEKISKVMNEKDFDWLIILSIMKKDTLLYEKLRSSKTQINFYQIIERNFKKICKCNGTKFCSCLFERIKIENFCTRNEKYCSKCL